MVATQPKASSPKQRLGYIDSVRGVAALYVLFQHTLEYAGFLHAHPGQIYNWIFNLGQSGVVAFFIVSGFIIPVSLERSPGAVSFWKHRILRIYPLYIFVMIVTTVLLVAYHHVPIEDPVKTISAQLLFVNSWIGLQNLVGNSWTLVIEMLWYIGIFAWWKMNGSLKVRLVSILSIGFALAMALLSLSLQLPLPFGRLGMFLACIVGLVALERTRDRLGSAEFGILLFALSATCLVLLYVGFAVQIDARSELFPFDVIAGSWLLGGVTFFVFYALRNSAISNLPVLLYVGKISFSLYLVHSPVLSVLVDYLTGIPLVVATVAISFVISHLTYHFIEYPFVLLGRGGRPRAERQPA